MCVTGPLQHSSPPAALRSVLPLLTVSRLLYTDHVVLMGGGEGDAHFVVNGVSTATARGGVTSRDSAAAISCLAAGGG